MGVSAVLPQRLARASDADRISELMRASVLDIGRAILDSCERAARAEGFTALALMATLPGEQLYRAYGFRETARPMLSMPDGVMVEGVAMERPIG